MFPDEEIGRTPILVVNSALLATLTKNLPIISEAEAIVARSIVTLPTDSVAVSPEPSTDPSF